MLNYQVINPEKEKCLIFITGAGIGKWMWQHQINALDNKLILFDLPGHGDNSHLDFTTIEECVLNILEILDCEDIDKITFVGHSIGAQIIMHILEHHNGYVENAVVISGLNKSMKWAVPLISSTVSLSMPLIKKRWFSKLQSKELSLPESMFENYYRDSLKISKTTLANILKENMTFRFKQTDVKEDKITFIVGSKEKKIMLTSAKQNAELIKGSHYICIEKTAHGIPYEAPEQLNDIIKKILEN
ncbi:MAG: alpha/beta hydrolase [Clostridiales bacterium]|nr:alpha/beta hydrolase [Clostridiales bacterium]